MSFKYLFFVGFLLDAVSCQMEGTLANVPEDGRLDFTDLTTKYGHPSVAREVITTDGYILQIFNLPGDKKKPVLLLHGVFDSSMGFVIRGNTSLGIMLANEGYDVWAMNSRGNRYSRKHETMDPDKDIQFWDFSAHEYGSYDLSACIDYVLNATGQKQLTLIGFSEGTTAAFILGSTQPEYNDKVKLFVAMAPVAFLDNVRSTLYTIIQISPFLNFILPEFVQEIAGYTSFTKAMINWLCTQLPIGYELCYYFGFNSVSGSDSNGIERAFFSTVVAHFPAGTSRKTLMHYAQMNLRGSFAPYDYGTTKNLNVYHSFTPPEYDVTKVTMNTVLLSAKNDPVSTIEDVKMLTKKLPNMLKYIVIDKDKYNHLDHVWAYDAATLEYPLILNVLAEHTKSWPN